MTIKRVRVRAPRKVRVLCPKGHRIGTITMRDHGDARLGIDLQIKELRGKWVDVYQHDPDSGETLKKVEIECPHRNCGYKGRIGYARLVAELAADVAKSATGHAEHRLTR